MMDMGFGFGFGNIMFYIVPIIITIVFIFVFGMIIVSAIKGAKTYSQNNKSPILTVEAKVVTKRTDVNRHTHHNNDNMAMNHHTYSTTYYVAFEVESGDRLEFEVRGDQYGLLVEGDKGKLTFQGTRYKGFERN